VYNTNINNFKGETNMKKLTVKQKQVIYEHLLTLDCPDLLAALIAERSTRYSRHLCTTIYDVVFENFAWYSTPEESDGDAFWSKIHEELIELENTVPAPQKYEVALQEALEDDFESPTEKDFVSKDKQRLGEIEIKVDASSFRDDMKNFQAEFSKEIQLSPWTKIKLFFGRIFYKV
jgi:hypothetical protein